MAKVEKWKTIKVPERFWRIVRKLAADSDKNFYQILEDKFR